MYRLKMLQYPLVSTLKGIRCLPELDQGVATIVVEPELEPKLEPELEPELEPVY
jgi:hypothetical protein